MVFQVGDRVKCVDNGHGGGFIPVGATGVVVGILGHNVIGVRWDDYIGGHDCDGYCEIGYGWWMSGRQLIHNAEPEPIFEPNSDEAFLQLISHK